MSTIQGQPLEVSVICCSRLKDTEWITTQDPYVSLQYAKRKYRTRTDTDGGTNPVFQERIMFTLIEGLRELEVEVWNSNTLTSDVFIGSGIVLLQKVISQGFDDTAWPLHTQSGRQAGEVKLMMRYTKPEICQSKPNKAKKSKGASYQAHPPFPDPYAHSNASYQSPPHYAPFPPAPPPYNYHATQPPTYPPQYTWPQSPQPPTYPPQYTWPQSPHPHPPYPHYATGSSHGGYPQ